MASTLRATAAVLALALSGPLLSQNATVPALLNGLEGGSGTSIPFGTSQPVRVQYVYDQEDLPWQGPRAVARVSLRADNADPGVTSFPQKAFVFVSLLLSTTSVRAADASSVYEDNYGADAMVVLDNVPMALPAQPALPGVRPANIDFVLPVPWFYGLTPARPGAPAPANLLVELRVHSQPTGAYRIDNVGSCQSPSTAFGNQGPACAPPGGLALSLQPGASMVAGGSFTWTIRNATPNGLCLLFLGTRTTGPLGGQPSLPLPVPLFDAANPLAGNPALVQLLPALQYGAPDCWINLEPADALFATADGAGTANVTIALAADRSFVGAAISAQAVAYTQTANPLQFMTSLGQQTTVCGPLGVARIYTLGSADAASGQRSLGQGAVFEFH